MAYLIYNLSRTAGAITITSYKDTVLIYNPRAGKFGRKGAGLVERAREILTNTGHKVTVRPTTGPGAAGAIARDAIAAGADLIVAAGGDGTINETAQGMLNSSVPLGILPAGTANVLAMEMRIPRDFERAAERLAECRPHRIAVGELTRDGEAPRHFLLMAGIGLDAQVVARVHPGLKARTGKFAYWVAGWTLLGRALPEFRTVIDGQERRGSFALVARVRNYGGDFEIARETTLFDNQFEVVLFEGSNVTVYVKYFAGMVLNRLGNLKGVTIARASEVIIDLPQTGRAFVQVDGEFAGQAPVKIAIVPDALTLLIPPSYGGRA